MLDFNNIRLVLVEPSHPGNIGAAARAMKNMGLQRLTLVNPKQFPSGVAVGRAASAVDVLEEAVVVDNLEQAIEGCGLVIGASARSRRIPWPMLNPRQCAEQVISELPRHKVALVFGREDRGLRNEELQLCQFHVNIPACEDYSSLNLAAAIMVVSYELRMSLLDKENLLPTADQVETQQWDQEKASSEELESFFSHLEQTLIAIKFHDPHNPRQLMTRLRRLYGRIRPDKMEMNILRGILTHTLYNVNKQA